MKYALPIATLVFAGLSLIVGEISPQLDSLGVREEYPVMAEKIFRIIGTGLAALTGYLGFQAIAFPQPQASKSK